jgi:two-component system sensor histidine kinase TctE
MTLIAAITWLVVTRALQPLNALRGELQQRKAGDTSLLATRGQEELQPVIDEMNQLLARQQDLLHQQRRFVADASHQLRTPLTVLKTQLQSTMGGDAPAAEVLPDMLRTVDRIAHLANQMLTKMRLEETPGPTAREELKLDEIAREAVLELSPLIAQRRLGFALEGQAPSVHGSPWMAGELVRNLLANAIRHSPLGGQLGIRFERATEELRMVVWDSGPGIDDAMRAWLFQPFASTKGVAGAGLGLAICLDIATAMGAHIALNNRCSNDGGVLGLDAVVSWDAAGT